MHREPGSTRLGSCALQFRQRWLSALSTFLARLCAECCHVCRLSRACDTVMCHFAGLATAAVLRRLGLIVLEEDAEAGVLTLSPDEISRWSRSSHNRHGPPTPNTASLQNEGVGSPSFVVQASLHRGGPFCVQSLRIRHPLLADASLKERSDLVLRTGTRCASAQPVMGLHGSGCAGQSCSCQHLPSCAEVTASRRQ